MNFFSKVMAFSGHFKLRVHAYIFVNHLYVFHIAGYTYYVYMYISNILIILLQVLAGNQTDMKAVVLAAGYGTRLERDLKEDTSQKYKQLIGTPKPLLPIGRLPLISYWANVTESLSETEALWVVVIRIFTLIANSNFTCLRFLDTMSMGVVSF